MLHPSRVMQDMKTLNHLLQNEQYELTRRASKDIDELKNSHQKAQEGDGEVAINGEVAIEMKHFEKN